jgi:hypothetical protein
MIRISHSEWLIWATAVMNNPGVIAAPDRRIGPDSAGIPGLG